MSDHPALNAAAAAGAVLPVFVVDPAIWGPSGEVRREYLRRSLEALNGSLRGGLTIRTGDPVEVLPTLAREVAASSVHISADHGPYGSQRDVAVGRALSDIGVTLDASGSPYAVSPGRVRKADGTPYRVFTPFYRAWCAHGWRRPAQSAHRLATSPSSTVSAAIDFRRRQTVRPARLPCSYQRRERPQH